jgi:glycolate oxidase FAD binding subunit
MTNAGDDRTEALLEAVREALARRDPLVIRGSGSKDFYGRRYTGTPLEVAGHRGIVAYEATELVLTARAGTPLAEIESVLANHGQMLPFEPPHFGLHATLGGTIACGLSGPRRPFSGAVRDAVLGVRLITGHGELLAMGGQVIKNVAGFDVPRLMVGALGTLAVILEISLKVLPRPETERSMVLAADPPKALARMQELLRQPWPLSGLAYDHGRLLVRLAGADAAVAAAAKQIGGEGLAEQEDYWNALKEQRLAFFHQESPLWRFVVPPAHPHPADCGDSVIDWGGGLRWVRSTDSAARLFALSRHAGGHACLFRGGDDVEPRFQPLPSPLLGLHQRIKQAFDPYRIFNRGRLYAEL